MKVGENMACELCQKQDIEHLVDNINKGTNNYSLSVYRDHLRLWHHKDSYKGCYAINYCPVCGKNLKTGEEGQIICEDIEEKQYAYWIDENINDGTIYCSKCGTVEKPSDSQYKSPRCPNCGAHMR